MPTGDASRGKTQLVWRVVGAHPSALLSGALLARHGFLIDWDLADDRMDWVFRNKDTFWDPEPDLLLGAEPVEARGNRPLGLWDRLLSSVLENRASALMMAGSSPVVVSAGARVSLERYFLEESPEFCRELRDFVPDGLKSRGFPSVDEARALGHRMHAYWRRLPDRLVPRRIASLWPQDSGGDAQAAEATDVEQADGVEIVAPLAERRGGGLKSNPEREGELRAMMEALSDYARSGFACYGGRPNLQELLVAFGLLSRTGRIRGGVSNLRKELARQFTAKRELPADAKHVGSALGQTGPGATGFVFSFSALFRTRSLPPTDRIGGESLTFAYAEERAMFARFYRTAEGRDKLTLRPECTNVHLSVCLPLELTYSAEDFTRIQSRMLLRFREVFPSAQLEDGSLLPDFSKKDGSRGEAERFFLERLPANSVPSTLLAFPTAGRGVRRSEMGVGQFVLDDRAYPELGSLGWAVAAVEAAAWAANRAGLPGPVDVKLQESSKESNA